MKKKLSAILSAVLLCALCVAPASALEYSIDGADDYLFGRPTSDDTIYEWENPNVNRCKNNFISVFLLCTAEYHFFLNYIKRSLCRIGTHKQLGQEDFICFKACANLIKCRNDMMIYNIKRIMILQKLFCTDCRIFFHSLNDCRMKRNLCFCLRHFRNRYTFYIFRAVFIKG